MSIINNSCAAPAILIDPVAEDIVMLPEPEEIVFPLSCKLSTRRLSILLFASTISAELAVSVPAVWSSIFTYNSPPIVVTAADCGCPINNLSLELE